MDKQAGAEEYLYSHICPRCRKVSFTRQHAPEWWTMVAMLAGAGVFEAVTWVGSIIHIGEGGGLSSLEMLPLALAAGTLCVAGVNRVIGRKNLIHECPFCHYHWAGEGK